MALLGGEVLRQATVGCRSADIRMSAVLPRLFFVLYFVGAALHPPHEGSDGIFRTSWTTLTLGAELQTAKDLTEENHHSSPLARNARVLPAPEAPTGLRSRLSVYGARSTTPKEELSRRPASENQPTTNDIVHGQFSPASGLPTLPSHADVSDNAESTLLDARRKGDWVSESSINTDGLARPRFADVQSRRQVTRSLSVTNAPVTVPIDSLSASSEADQLHNECYLLTSLVDAVRHLKRALEADKAVHSDATRSVPDGFGFRQSIQTDPSSMANPWREGVSWGRPGGMRGFRGRVLQSLSLPCTSLPSLPVQHTRAFHVLRSLLCQVSRASAAGLTRSAHTQSLASSALSPKQQKSLPAFPPPSITQQLQLLQQDCQKASQQQGQQRGTQQLWSFGGAVTDLRPKAVFASSSSSSSTFSSASSTHTSSAAGDKNMDLPPTEPPCSASTGGGGPSQVTTTFQGSSNSGTAPALLDNNFHEHSPISTVETTSVPPSSNNFTDEIVDFPAAETAATDSSDEILFSPELLGDTDSTETSSLPRRLTRITTGPFALAQSPKAEEEARESLATSRHLQQGASLQQFHPSGILFDSGALRTRLTGDIETASAAVLFPRARIAWYIENGARSRLPLPVREAQLRGVSSAEGRSWRDDQQQNNTSDKTDRQNPSQLTMADLDHARAQLTGVLYDVLQRLIDNPGELRAELEEDSLKKRRPVLEAGQHHEQESQETAAQHAEVQPLADTSGESAMLEASGVRAPERSA